MKEKKETGRHGGGEPGRQQDGRTLGARRGHYCLANETGRCGDEEKPSTDCSASTILIGHLAGTNERGPADLLARATAECSTPMNLPRHAVQAAAQSDALGWLDKVISKNEESSYNIPEDLLESCNGCCQSRKKNKREIKERRKNRC